MAHRVLLDAHGIEWQVWAVVRTPAQRGSRQRGRESQPSVRPAYEGGWLAFQSADEHRRMSPIPSGWELLDDVHLASLLARAQVVPHHGRLIE